MPRAPDALPADERFMGRSCRSRLNGDYCHPGSGGRAAGGEVFQEILPRATMPGSRRPAPSRTPRPLYGPRELDGPPVNLAPAGAGPRFTLKPLHIELKHPPTPSYPCGHFCVSGPAFEEQADEPPTIEAAPRGLHRKANSPCWPVHRRKLQGRRARSFYSALSRPSRAARLERTCSASRMRANSSAPPA